MRTNSIIVLILVSAFFVMPNPGQAQTIVDVGISPNIAEPTARLYFEAVTSLLGPVICRQGDRLTVFDTATRSTVMAIELGQRFSDAECGSARTRNWIEELHRTEAGQLGRWLSRLNSGTTTAVANTNPSRFLRLIADRKSYVGQEDRYLVFLLGSLVENDLQGGLSTADGVVPSLEHLDSELSPWSTNRLSGALRGVHVHVVIPTEGQPYQSPLHQRLLGGFHSSFIAAQGGTLISHSEDLDLVSRASIRGAGVPVEPSLSSDGKPVLFSLREDGDLWREMPANAPQPGPPPVSEGSMRIGIRWESASDLDLYCRPRGGASEASFRNPQPGDWRGRHHRDYITNEDGSRWEEISFGDRVQLGALRCRVNRYRGSPARPEPVEVRVLFAGRLYRGVVRLPPGPGNRGAESPRKAWQTIDLLSITGGRVQ